MHFTITFKRITGRRWCQYVASITSSLGIICSEMHFGWPSPALPVLTNGTYYFQVSGETASWLAVVIFPGIVCGAILASFLTDTIGRRRMILATTIPLFFSWILLALARNAAVMFIARFLGGIGGGLSFATVPMYLGEISEPSIRGLLSSICPVFVVIGILLINVLGVYLTIEHSAFFASSIALVMACTFWWMPESPIWLLSRRNEKEAKKMLQTLRGNEEGEIEFVRLTEDLEKSMEDRCKSIQSFLNLFRDPINRRALLISAGLRSIQQLCGSTAITFYCKTIFQENEGFVSANHATIIYFSLQASLAVITLFIVDIVGRRPLFIFSLAGTTLTLFSAGGYMLIKDHSDIDLTSFTSVPMASLLLNVSFFSMGIRNIPLLVMSEIFNSKIKSSALCIVTIYYGVLAILVTKFFHITNDTVEMAFPMITFGVLSLVSLILYYFYVPETKGKTLEEIQEILENY